MENFVQVPPDSTGKRVNMELFNDGQNDVYTQVNHIADRSNPDQMLSVDEYGAAYTRFANGDPIFDSFGRLKITDTNLLSAYKFYDGPASIFGRVEEEQIGGGTVAFNPTLSGYTLTTSAASGDRAAMTTHRHFPYKPGSSITHLFVVSSGDSGKANVVRRVGTSNFTRNNGIWMELNGTSFDIVIKNSLTGGEERVSQAAFNGDRLNGEKGDFNRSGVTADFTKSAIYWVTFQYLSAGAVTIGTFINGKPTVIHTFGHYNELDRPYMGTTELGFFVEQENIGSPGSASEMTVFCSAIVSEGYDELIRTPLAVRANDTFTTADNVPLISFRPAQSYNGKDNRMRYLIETVSLYTSTEPVEVNLTLNGTLTADTWTEQKMGLEYDTGATAITGGHEFGGYIFAPGSQPTQKLCDLFNEMTDGLYRNADINNTDIWTLSVRKLEGATTNVHMTGMLMEVAG